MFFGKWKYVLFKGGSKMSYICCHFFRTLSLSVKLQNWHFTLPDPLKYMNRLMTWKSKSFSTSKETKIRKSLQSSDRTGRGSAPPRSLSRPPALSGNSRTASLTRYFMQEATRDGRPAPHCGEGGVPRSDPPRKNDHNITPLNMSEPEQCLIQRVNRICKGQ